MSSQSRTQSGKFAPKSDQVRQVRSIRLTDAAWEKLGRIAASKGMTRADFLEEVLEDSDPQLSLFQDEPLGKVNRESKEVITKDTRKTGTELAIRLGVSSAALTNWIKAGQLVEKTRSRDPDGIAWDREQGGKLYYPILE